MLLWSIIKNYKKNKLNKFHNRIFGGIKVTKHNLEKKTVEHYVIN